ncbi:MAG TPA: CBS domain-containing protein [Bacillus sp. (in: firmicutes)]|uniref:CBS domain-containing protein n=1 Tax=Bacillus litorisediminis TaxID=2922713 RepID=UPI001FABC751|nr:CBS domain-containing protein [Bacillus litorisediminis]HWO78069.1 CBS domain-containing protein [Bacillus sp. (in: firmicutes)]
MQVRDVMSTNVESCSSNDSIEAVAQKMKNLNVGAIPVVENGQVVGMITDRDLAVRGVAENRSNAGDVATTQSVVTCSPDMSVDEAAALMAQHQVRRLPVVENGQLVGIVALGDLAVREQSNEMAGGALTNISKPDGQMQ